MAQEKEFLKESISELQNTIYNLESDNSALNSTLQLVYTSNQQFRQRVIIGLLTGNLIYIYIYIFCYKAMIVIDLVTWQRR